MKICEACFTREPFVYKDKVDFVVYGRDSEVCEFCKGLWKTADIPRDIVWRKDVDWKQENPENY